MAMYARSIDELWNAGSDVVSKRILDAVGRGDFQIVPDIRGTVEEHPNFTPHILILTETGTIYEGRQGEQTDYGFAPQPDEFYIEPSSFEYFIFKVEGEGRDDIKKMWDERGRVAAWMHREAERDSESAFGGRGNNVII